MHLTSARALTLSSCTVARLHASLCALVGGRALPRGCVERQRASGFRRMTPCHGWCMLF